MRSTIRNGSTQEEKENWFLIFQIQIPLPFRQLATADYIHYSGTSTHRKTTIV
jgi:hypothetical protein